MSRKSSKSNKTRRFVKSSHGSQHPSRGTTTKGRHVVNQPSLTISEKIFGSTPGNPKTSKIAWWRIWMEVYKRYSTRYNSEGLIKRRNSLYSEGTALLSGEEQVTYLYALNGYPSSLPIGYSENIRSVIVGDTRVSFLSSFEPSPIDWSDPTMIARMKQYKSIDNDLDEKDIDEYNYRENIRSLDINRLRKDSIIYLSEADSKRDRQLFRYRRLMLVSGYRGEEFDRDIERIEARCNALGLKMDRVLNNLKGYLETFSPTSQNIDSKVRAATGTNVIPDEMISRFSSFDQGKIGIEGVYMGTDIESYFPVLKKFKKTDESAENIMCLAETGWGKSFFIKILFIQLLGLRRTIGTIMDIEGFEYAPIAAYFANNDVVVQIKMTGGEGSYFDPVEIVLTGNKDKDSESMANSINFTSNLFYTIMTDIVDLPWFKVIVEDAISEAYVRHGVLEKDMSTWSNSKGMTIYDIYNIIKDKHFDIMTHQETPSLPVPDFKYRDKDYVKTFTLIRARLAQYFEPLDKGGSRSWVFKNRVPLERIQRAKLVVCSFGLASKDAGVQVDEIQLALTQLSAANISSIRSLYAHSVGKFNVKVWEELQRWVELPGSTGILNTTITGGRKLGDINFLLSNDPTMFMGSGLAKSIFNNVTSFFIGNINDTMVRQEIAQRLNVEELLPELDKIHSFAGDAESFNSSTVDIRLESPYYRSFLVKLDKSVEAVVKMYIPEQIAKSKLLKTGSSEE